MISPRIPATAARPDRFVTAPGHDSAAGRISQKRLQGPGGHTGRGAAPYISGGARRARPIRLISRRRAALVGGQALLVEAAEATAG